MIQYMITHEVKGLVDNYTLRSTGHAGFAEEGKDIVCSAVSAITVTLAQRIEDLSQTECDGNVYTEIEPGKAFIYCQCPRGNAKVREAFEFAELGLRMISAQYPEHVQMG